MANCVLCTAIATRQQTIVHASTLKPWKSRNVEVMVKLIPVYKLYKKTHVKPTDQSTPARKDIVSVEYFFFYITIKKNIENNYS